MYTNTYVVLYVGLHAKFVTISGVFVPNKPGTPCIVATSAHSVELEWEAPVDKTGSAIVVQYILLYGHPDAAKFLYYRKKAAAAGKISSCTLKQRIWPGRTYRFAVAAENKAGCGEFSDFSEFVTVPSETGKSL